MEKILAKQIEGVVDTSSAQVIDGEKTFSSAVSFLNKQAQDFLGMRIHGAHIYWLRDLEQLDQEGNIRLGIDPRTGTFALQQFTRQWENLIL